MTHGLNVGDWVTTREQLRLLPVGTILEPRRSRPGGMIERHEDGRWVNEDGSEITIASFSLDNYNQVRHIGSGTVTPPPPPPTLNLAQFQQRFATLARGAARRSGISYDPVINILNQLGIGGLPVGPGMFVEWSDSDLCRALPEHTLAKVGPDVDGATRDGFYEYVKSHGWRNVLGDGAQTYYGKAVEVPSATVDAFMRPATEHDARAIAHFKATAWNLGVKAKSTNSWCGEFENAMRRAEITAEDAREDVPIPHAGSVAEVSVGSVVDMHVAAALPIGTIFRFAGDAIVWFIRTEARVTNTARTRRIFGNESSHYASSNMQVMHLGDETHMRIRITDRRWMHAAPIGTIITDRANEDRNFYAKVREDDGSSQCWVACTPQRTMNYNPEASGTYTSAAYHIESNPWYFAHIPYEGQ